MSKDVIWILGPCSVESSDLYMSTANSLMKLMCGKQWFYKASFDKANRTSVSGPRGPGLDYSIECFSNIRETHPGIMLTTDVHEPWQAEKLCEFIDCIQIPAFLCRQTDLITECARLYTRINIKKGQWMAPDNMCKGIDKVKSINPDAEVWLTERGTFFGYQRLVIDYYSVEIFKKYFDRVVMDGTHATQRGKGSFTGGSRELAKKYIIASAVFGYNGVFAECHPDPDKAVSDADCQIRLDDIEQLIKTYDSVNNEVR